jgi:hypothetical protein
MIIVTVEVIQSPDHAVNATGISIEDRSPAGCRECHPDNTPRDKDLARDMYRAWQAELAT